jgi:magnesium-transporting ATPase (P-type)
MSTILEGVTGTDHGYDKRLHSKGASEIVLNHCTHYIDTTGEKREITEEKKNEILEIIDNFGIKALRTITLAYKDLKPGLGGPLHEELS